MSEDRFELQKKARELKDQKRYEEAIPLYKTLWEIEPEQRDKWDGWNLATCLRKNGDSQGALNIAREVYQLDREFDHNNNLYGWCVYDIGIKQDEEHFDEQQFIKAAEAIIQLTRHEPYSPFENAVFRVIHHFEHYKDAQKPIPYTKIIEWLQKLDPDQLSAQPQKWSDGSLHQSPKEDWYTSWAKALYGTEQYEECIEVCTRAIKEFPKPYYDYDIWFRKLRSDSYIALERYEDAITDIEYMMDRKNDFWIKRNYALILHKLGKIEEAIQYAAVAALPPKGLGFRWEVFLELGMMLAEIGEDELAKKHVQLAVAIRQQEGWEKVPPQLQTAMQSLHITYDDIPDVKSLHKELKPFWQSQKPRKQTTHTGVIDHLHSNGKSGMIRGDNGQKYFFPIKAYTENGEPEQGQKVGFNLRDVVNKHTGAPEKHATDIQIV